MILSTGAILLRSEREIVLQLGNVIHSPSVKYGLSSSLRLRTEMREGEGQRKNNPEIKQYLRGDLFKRRYNIAIFA